MSQPEREQWSSRAGFLLAAVGSAVGLGNMWRFSYLTAENGGAAFVAIYVVLTLLVGVPVLIAEFAIGRGARRSPIEALGRFGGSAWQLLGALFVASGFLIASYYSVIAGWTLRYFADALWSGFPADGGAQFGAVINNAEAVGWHLGFMAISLVTVMGGVKLGIERAAVVLMPVLLLVVIGIAVYASTLDGAAQGYEYYLQIDFASLSKPGVLNAAASQAFFSLSLGMGAMMTYASYLPEETNLAGEAAFVAAADFAVAFISGLAVFPMIFALGLSAAVGESTVGALFITLPTAFAQMGGAGRVVGALFFGALFIGALTSMISLLEVVVSSAMDRLACTRQTATLAVGGLMAALGIAPALDDGLLGTMDTYAGNLFLVVGGLALAVFAGWVWNDPLAELEKGAPGARWLVGWRWLMRVPVPLVLIFVLYEFAKGVLAAD
jgi:NSS family neurotransmitter:Na+ symporter